MTDHTPTPEVDEYVLGTDDGELRRLGFQHRVWARELEDLWRLAQFGDGQRILDVGCGPGYASFDLATLVGPRGKVVAIDQSERFVQRISSEARRLALSNVEAHEADVQALDLPAASFDGAFARWVLCFVPDPDAVVAGVAKSLRPGGSFAVQDYFNYLGVTVGPKHEVFDRVVQATDRSWREMGGDPDIGGRLPGIFERHGLRVRAIEPVVRVARPGDSLWQWPESFFALFIPRLISMGLLTETDQEAFDSMWRERSADPTSTFFTPPVLNIVGEKL